MLCCQYNHQHIKPYHYLLKQQSVTYAIGVIARNILPCLWHVSHCPSHAEIVQFPGAPHWLPYEVLSHHAAKEKHTCCIIINPQQFYITIISFFAKGQSRKGQKVYNQGPYSQKACKPLCACKRYTNTTQ